MRIVASRVGSNATKVRTFTSGKGNENVGKRFSGTSPSLPLFSPVYILLLPTSTQRESEHRRRSGQSAIFFSFLLPLHSLFIRLCAAIRSLANKPPKKRGCQENQKSPGAPGEDPRGSPQEAREEIKCKPLRGFLPFLCPLLHHRSDTGLFDSVSKNPAFLSMFSARTRLMCHWTQISFL